MCNSSCIFYYQYLATYSYSTYTRKCAHTSILTSLAVCSEPVWLQALSSTCFTLQCALAQFHHEEVGMFYVHPEDDQLFGMTVKDSETSGYNFFIYRCSVKDFECKVSFVVFSFMMMLITVCFHFDCVIVIECGCKEEVRGLIGGIYEVEPS